MTDVLEMICECLAQKKALFDQYATYTDQMVACDIEELEHYITQRADLTIAIDKIDVEISTLCEAYSDSEILRDAIGSRGNYVDYPPELQAVYDEAAQIFGVVNRVYQQEPGILQRMTEERERLLEKIKGESNMPKVMKYVRGLSSPSETGTYLGGKYDKV